MKNESDSRPTHDAISGRARTLWQAAGSPDGEDLVHWLQAEKELNEENAESDGEFTGTSDSPSPTPAGTIGSARPPVPAGKRQQGKKL